MQIKWEDTNTPHPLVGTEGSTLQDLFDIAEIHPDLQKKVLEAYEDPKIRDRAKLAFSFGDDLNSPELRTAMDKRVMPYIISSKLDEARRGITKNYSATKEFTNYFNKALESFKPNSSISLNDQNLATVA